MLSVPVIIEMIGEAFFAIIDMAFVSRITTNATEAVATVGFTESVMFIIYSIAIGLSMATTAVVSRRTGEKDLEGAAKATNQAIIVGMVTGTILGLIGFVFAPQILGLMGASDKVISQGTYFTRIVFSGNVVIMLLYLINGAFRGAGNASIAMRALLLANAFNIVFDPIFIFGFGPIPALGLEGAAIATTAGRTLGVLFQLYILFNGKSLLKLARKSFNVDWSIIKNLLSVSIGGIGQFLVDTASWLFLMTIIAKSGDSAAAGYTFGFRIIGFTILPAWGLAQAAATLVGQNLGAKQEERAEKSVWKSCWYTTYYLFAVAVVFFIGAEWIITHVFEGEAQVVEYAKHMLQIICLGYLFFGFGMVTSSAFNGAGDTKTPTFINIAIMWVVQIPLAIFLAQVLDMGVYGVFTTIAICHSLHAVVSVQIFRLGKWKTQKV